MELPIIILILFVFVFCFFAVEVCEERFEFFLPVFPDHENVVYEPNPQ